MTAQRQAYEPRGGSGDEPPGATSSAGPTAPAADPESRVGSSRRLGRQMMFGQAPLKAITT